MTAHAGGRHVNIIPLHGTERLDEFIEFPWEVYRTDPLWVPPVREQVFHQLSGASPFAGSGRVQLFLAESDGRVVGRVAALINEGVRDRDGAVMGQLGFFECLDDVGIALGLVDAGLQWLRARGARAVLAPMNGGAHRTHRLLTRGFDRRPFLFEPRNPPYYPRLLEHCGFKVVHRWFSYELSRAECADRWSRYTRLVSRRPAPCRIVELSVERTAETMARVHALLDACWTGHIGYAPLGMDEFAEVFQGPLSVMREGNLSVLTGDEGDVGLEFLYPDYADDMRALDGHAAGWGRWLGRSRPSRMVLSTAALVPTARRTSAAMAQVAWAFGRALASDCDEFLISLVVEGFLNRIGEQTREYALYARPVV
jgi:hypothetical protein